MTVESPCIGLCKLDENHVCIGCYRTDNEIGRWMYATDQEKLHILEDTKKRIVKGKTYEQRFRKNQSKQAQTER
jgi:predicted Fe-S protein YdhL (DUF1289 family)